mmetsp:Transcript_18746/g.28785  ORF Transcript_18746/g.28785 Transcript_18746/m.28785 type:complete len:80 (+) Transcript_18746:618-857(+)
MDKKYITKNIKKHDLKPEIGEEEGHSLIASAMASFLSGLFAGGSGTKATEKLGAFATFTDEFMAPFMEGMRLEGSYEQK